jgi:hypothetical protein
MTWLWYTLGFGCGGLVLFLLVGIIALMLENRNKRKRVLAEGDQTIAWLVQANVLLFEDGIMDLPAQVLISKDKEADEDEDEEFMTQLVERIRQLKGVDPAQCKDKDEAFVAELMASEDYIEGRRDKLPTGFAVKPKIYLAQIMVYRDDLPEKKITEPRIPVAVIWDDPKSLICTRPV